MGRPKKLTPESLWIHFQAYRKAVKAKPITVKDWVGGMAKCVTRRKERPLTMDGFEIYLWEKGVVSDLGLYLANKDGAYSEFLTICTRVRQIIKDDQISGGMAGIYNPSITQRLNALSDNVNTTVTEQPLFPDKK